MLKLESSLSLLRKLSNCLLMEKNRNSLKFGGTISTQTTTDKNSRKRSIFTSFPSQLPLTESSSIQKILLMSSKKSINRNMKKSGMIRLSSTSKRKNIISILSKTFSTPLKSYNKIQKLFRKLLKEREDRSTSYKPLETDQKEKTMKKMLNTIFSLISLTTFWVKIL